jgi:hypothetical protein
MDALTRYTLNSGEYTNLPRRPLSRRTTTCLRRLVPSGGGPLPGVLARYAFRVEAPLGDGGRLFWLLRDDIPLICAGVCSDLDCAWETYETVERVYFDALLEGATGPAARFGPWVGLCAHAPSMPYSLPWLARVILPGLRSGTPRELTWIEEFERCVAWTLLARRPVRR